VTEFQSRRELREAERMGLVPKPEQVFDLPTGQIQLPEIKPQDLPSAGEMLTRKKIRELERQGLLDPLTGAVAIPEVATENLRPYDEVLAETEEPITSTVNTISSAPLPAAEQPVERVQPATPPRVQMPATDIFHSMAVDPKARRPRFGLLIAIILIVFAGLGAAAYMLGIFK
jgi:hypothetical protein